MNEKQTTTVSYLMAFAFLAFSLVMIVTLGKDTSGPSAPTYQDQCEAVGGKVERTTRYIGKLMTTEQRCIINK